MKHNTEHRQVQNGLAAAGQKRPDLRRWPVWHLRAIVGIAGSFPRLRSQFLLCGLSLLLASCAADKNAATTPPATAAVWPPPPSEPRIRYVESIYGPAGIGQRRSVWTHVSDWVSGRPAQRDDLIKPFGVALDETGNLCLTDTGAGAVCYCDFLHKHWKRFEGTGKTRFAAPVAIARKAGVFYVADSELGKVLAFGDDGRTVMEISLERPTALAIAGDTLFVADSQTHSVSAFDLQGHLRFQFGKRGSAPGEFNFPTHLAADAQGRLYVTDSMNSRIQVFDLQGHFLRALGSSGDTSGHFSRPKGVAADSAGNIYVLDAIFDNLQIFDGEGRLLLELGQTGHGPGEFWLPNGIAISPNNRIFVTDSFNRRVQVFEYLGK